MKKLASIVFVLGLAVGCGGGGNDGTLIREATVEDAKEVCEYGNDHLWASKSCTVDGETGTIPAAEPEDCSMIDEGGSDIPATCTATIGDYKDCIDAIEDDPCILAQESPTGACGKIFSADCLGGDARTLERVRFALDAATKLAQ